MTRLLLTLSLFLCGSNAWTQNCDCSSQFSLVKKYFESNNPAFQSIKDDKNLYRKYDGQVKKLAKKISHERSNDRCKVYFDQYVALLKDHHSGIDLNIQRLHVDPDSSQSILDFKATTAYKSFAKIPIDTTTLIPQLKAKPQENIEGLYSNGRTLVIGIIKSGPDQYLGVVVKNNSLLEVGHILMEFKKINDMAYDCVYHTGLLGLNFQQVNEKIEIKNGQIPEFGLTKVNLQSTGDIYPYKFQELDQWTNYLQLSSFDKNLKPELDSLYQSIDSTVQSKPYLIIDLRDNAGGSEECYFDLVKYVYTKPLSIDKAEVWVSPDNIKRYREAGYSQKLIERMAKAEPFTFIPQVGETLQNWTMEGTVYPKDIAVLFNSKTASAAEGMILYSMQSDKVITMGENSGGYIGFGDVMTVNLPCGKYSLRSSTTRYKNKFRYEFVGIPPMHQLRGDQNWVDYAQEVLQKQ